MALSLASQVHNPRLAQTDGGSPAGGSAGTPGRTAPQGAELAKTSLEESLVTLRNENSRLTLRLSSREEEAKLATSLLQGEKGKAERAESELRTIKDKAWGVTQTLEKYKKTVDSLSLDAEQHKVDAEQHKAEMGRVRDELNQTNAALEESKKTASDATAALASKNASASAAEPANASNTGVWSSSARGQSSAQGVGAEAAEEDGDGAPDGDEVLTKEQFEAQARVVQYRPHPTLSTIYPAHRCRGSACVPAYPPRRVPGVADTCPLAQALEHCPPLTPQCPAPASHVSRRAMLMSAGMIRRMEAAEVLLRTRITELSRELNEAKAAALRAPEVRLCGDPYGVGCGV